MIEQASLTAFASLGGSLPREGDTVTMYTSTATQTLRIRRVPGKSQPFQGIAVLSVLTEREGHGDDPDAKNHD